MSDEEPNDGAEGLADDPATAAVLAALAPALGDEAVWAEPPASLADSIVAAIAAEREELDRDVVAPVPATRRARRPRSTWWLAAAAAIVAVAAVGVVVTRGGDGAGEEVAMAGTELAPGASATAHVRELGAGVEVRLDIEDLPPAPPGTYYQAWTRSPDGELVSMGTFHMRGGDDTVTLWSGVSTEDFPIITVTLQTEGAGAESSGQVVLRGSLDEGAAGQPAATTTTGG
jgi:hypothetical protein